MKKLNNSLILLIILVLIILGVLMVLALNINTQSEVYIMVENISKITIKRSLIGKHDYKSEFVFSNVPLLSVTDDNIFFTVRQTNGVYTYKQENISHMNTIRTDTTIKNLKLPSQESQYSFISKDIDSSNSIIVEMTVYDNQENIYKYIFEETEELNDLSESLDVINFYEELLKLLNKLELRDYFSEEIKVYVIKPTEKQIPDKDIKKVNTILQEGIYNISDNNFELQKTFSADWIFQDSQGDYYLVNYVPIIAF